MTWMTIAGLMVMALAISATIITGYGLWKYRAAMEDRP